MPILVPQLSQTLSVTASGSSSIRKVTSASVIVFHISCKCITFKPSWKRKFENYKFYLSVYLTNSMDKRLEVRKLRNIIYGVPPRVCPSRKNLVLIVPGALEIYSVRIKFYVNVFPRFSYSTDISYLKPTLVGLWLILCVFRDFPSPPEINQKQFSSYSDVPSQTSTKRTAH